MMADERDFELLDDYLSNRMGEVDRTAFAKKLQADADLKQEYALQQRLINGIRQARAAELKSMLNKVQIAPHNPGSTVASKVVLAAIVSLIIAGVGYWYFSRDEAQPAPPAVVTDELKKTDTPAVPETKQEAPEAKQPEVRQVPKAEPDKNQTSAGTEHSKPSLAKRPDPIYSPAPEEKSRKAESGKDENMTDVAGGSPLFIESDPDNKQYTFHYQFSNGKLILFGPFKDGGYETIELFIDGKRAWFLYYNEEYYALKEEITGVQPLNAVTDPDLIARLNESRQGQ